MTKRALIVPLLVPIAAGGAFPALACAHHASSATQGLPDGGAPAHGKATSAAAGTGAGGAGAGDVQNECGGHGGCGGLGGYGGAGGTTGAPGAGGAGRDGGGGAPANGGGGSTVSSTSSAAQTTSAGTAQSSSGSATCAVGHVLISEIRSRGAAGATDELVELFNATGAPVTLDAGWTLQVRGTSDTEYHAHWSGIGLSIPPWGHFLIAGAAYTETPAGDQPLTTGLPDAASLWLVHSGATVDAVCYAYDTATQAAFDASFTCAGTAVSNLPHNNASSAASDVDASIARKPGGAGGNCTDTGDNEADFVAQSPATPESTASPPTP